MKPITPKSTSDFDAIKITLASPEHIRKWSFGEVKEPETINYRTLKPEKEGLFCERIFGPVKDFECACGKYKKKKNKGIICDRCGVEVTESRVRRERMGHIQLVTPVAHIWFFKNLPNRISLLLDDSDEDYSDGTKKRLKVQGVKSKDVEAVIYYDKYYVIDPGDIPELVTYEVSLEDGRRRPINIKTILDEDEYESLVSRYGEESFVAEMGAGALRKALEKIDLALEEARLKVKLEKNKSAQTKKKLFKRLKLISQMLEAKLRPEYMILEVLPVIPADLRPLVPLDGGKFATSDLNDLYRRVIHRNNRLKRLMELNAPEIILRNEKRMLQEAVDALFDNGRRNRPVTGTGNRPLKSLSDMLKGKTGRFRQNLLGKRVDYSGRSVIVVDPKLRLDQCGIPKQMAIELFKPFLLNRIEDNISQTLKGARKVLEDQRPEVWAYLDDIIKDHPVMLNRAPTLHRLSIQAFIPQLVEGKAIKIHPLVCAAFNADFDGDQMGVHLPLSVEAQIEARMLMLSKYNILSPASGKPVATPSKDMVLGLYYLTKERRGQIGEGKIFGSAEEVMIAYENKRIALHAKIKLVGLNKIRELEKWTYEDIKNVSKWRDYTTVGRVIFNERVLPTGFRFLNITLGSRDKSIEKTISEVMKKFGNEAAVETLDNMKDVGFEFATRSGLTFAICDLLTPSTKKEKIEQTQKKVDKLWEQYRNGVITESERYNMIIDAWTQTNEEITDELLAQMKTDQDGFNPIYMMQDSGARGSRSQISQLAGMKGLLQKPQKKLSGGIGEIIEQPVTANFREGLNVLQYFISTHGARKGLADTALKTADAGYLTRKLVDVAQEVIIREDDCGTARGIEIGHLKGGDEILVHIADRIKGRTALHDVIDPDDVSQNLVSAGEIITDEIAQAIEDKGIESIYVRSVLTCEAKRGICAKCYGINLGTGRMAEMGDAVGIIAAQSIGEPGTQLTLRTFHIGGTASRILEQSEVKTKFSGYARLHDVRWVVNRHGEKVVVNRSGKIFLHDEQDKERSRFDVPYGAILKVEDGESLAVGKVIFEWDPFIRPIIAEKDGKISFEDIVEGKTIEEELDSSTATIQRVIIDDKTKKLHPRLLITGENENEDDNAADKKRTLYYLPTGAYLIVAKKDEVRAGDLLAKMPRQLGKTRDITGGLPRISELFEARKPEDAAVISDIDGIVEYGKIVRGVRTLLVRNEFGEEKRYAVPLSKQILVNPEDLVEAGEALTSGNVNPHDILTVKGVEEVQNYLVNEIQEVYRIQGVEINDKHIEIIVRQMTKKVRVVNPGDSMFPSQELVDNFKFMEENEKIIAEEKEPAIAKPELLGITKASLNTDSFLSAASFQETNRVLTEAALEGKVDSLEGLKENIIIGHLIPAGTAAKAYRDIDVMVIDEEYSTPRPKRVIQTDEDEKIIDEITDFDKAEPEEDVQPQEIDTDVEIKVKTSDDE